MNEEKMVESSVPVQGRVSVVILAEIARYWEEQGVEVKSMSQLVGWSLDLLNKVLRVNGMVKGEMSVAEGDKYLRMSRLYQRGMDRVSRQKIAAAIRMESIREEGGDTRVVDPFDHSRLHNVNSVKASKVNVIGELTTKAMEVYRELEKVNIRSKMTENELEMKERELAQGDQDMIERMKSAELNGSLNNLTDLFDDSNSKD